MDLEPLRQAFMARAKSTTTRRSSSSRSKNQEPAPPPPTWDERLIQGMVPWRLELAGFLLFVLASIFFLALLGLAQSGWLSSLTNMLRQLTGWGGYPISVTVAVIGVHIMLRRVEKPYQVRPGQVIGLELVLLTALALSHLFLGNGLSGALAGRGGGLIGWAFSEPLVDLLGPVLVTLIYVAAFCWGLGLILRIGWADIIQGLERASLQLRLWSNELQVDVAEREAAMSARRQTEAAPPPPAAVRRSAAETDEDELIIIDDSGPGRTTRVRRRSKLLPPMDALEAGSAVPLTTEEIDEKKRIIEQTLLDFGLPAVVTEIRRGPAVTQFGVQPGYIERPGPDGQIKQYKVRVNQISALQRDLALALAVTRLRVEAPVPGRGIVGVEVPNAETNVVRLRAIVESEPFYKMNSPLAVALGRDVAGGPVITDLGKLPHLLIAGTTGSGKSVCLNALLTCLVFNNKPENLRLVMIDPKKVEFIRFNGLPHLMGRVEVEADRVVGVLQWLTAEMDRRYELFAAAGAKHLQDFNRKLARQRADQQLPAQKLPYIAVFIDELADLIHAYPADVERTLCRLAQMARATGIHLVVATQRPSTDVITGLIKANFPARASFSVASNTDSRVILDTVGAEQLLGKGDMLFLPPDASAPLRIQGVFVSDREVETIVTHWQKVMPEAVNQEAPWENLLARMNFIDEKDDMLEQAIALAQKHDTLSTSLIQRRLRVGYPRAARLMEALYEMGLVEDPKEGGRTRKTYVDEEDDPLGDYLAQQNGE
jgi:DNA segregation ATPase FtsK/SpoIIIE, S-DNA-T family